MLCPKFIHCHANHDLCSWVKTFTSVRNNAAVCYLNSIRLEEAGGRSWHLRYSHFTGREKFHIIKVTQLPVLWFLGN